MDASDHRPDTGKACVAFSVVWCNTQREDNKNRQVKRLLLFYFRRIYFVGVFSLSRVPKGRGERGHKTDANTVIDNNNSSVQTLLLISSAMGVKPPRSDRSSYFHRKRESTTVLDSARRGSSVMKKKNDEEREEEMNVVDPPLVVCDHPNNHQSHSQPVGQVEVVQEEMGTNGTVVQRILCLPPCISAEANADKKGRTSFDDSTTLLDEEGEELDTYVVQEEDESIEVPEESLASTLMDVFLSGCIGFEPCSGPCRELKGILKKKDPPTSNSPATGRNVSFSCLDIKEFPLTLGDHPSATSGPPVMLAAQPLCQRVISLDEYEQKRCPRRPRQQLKLSYRDRKGILEREQGFTTEEVNQAWAQALKIRKQRHETLQRGPMMMYWDDAWESAQRKYRRIAESVGFAV
jgi:hypothetical protein